MPIGRLTRGTTNTNRLRRVDRWIADSAVLRRADDPFVVDLGYGASAVTVLELHRRLALRRADAEVLGLEIDPGRVARAREQLALVREGGTGFAADAAVRFGLGGFELPTGGRRPAIVRAFNVLRQYEEHEVPAAWERMTAALQPGGLLVEGTCDELGRVAAWVAVTAAGPRALSVSLRLEGLERPSIVAERLPKALIHRNVPGEAVHTFLTALDRAWMHHAPLSVYGASQRWIATVDALRREGWPLLGPRRRARLGELTVAWSAVAPG
ncbi:class I SAM-dependent methyltransferase [Agromyces archimandritae]|uniref:Class I SAM-dependent methyltransferase n=1 Tax=Agromyces archimandritae TaxID=2781962 RepID=A0A975FK24_9MICO|nr:class I SAM-dependent methyltransferase [Agromyces archimandritae]QTX03975.1 class I SAM-dependent methyltransferase [Agromyces archimandritae]